MILMIDNYDSFTYNLVQYLRELSYDVRVHRNDEIQIEDIKNLTPERIIISPGPGNPDEAGISLKVIQHFAGKIPILGVCLGHQVIAQAFGGVVKSARQIMHGKTSQIFHSQQSIFQHLPNPITVTRYHSLIVDKTNLPKEFEITAWTTQDDGSFDEIMAIRHRTWPLEGVQFHPESILTQCGKEMLSNFCKVS